MNTRAGNNLGSVARHALTNGSVTTLIDRINCAGCSENSGVTYIPSAFKTEIRLTRGKMDLVCMGTAHADLALATIAIEDLQIRIPVYKPKAQLTAALNTSFVKNSQEAKYYTTTFRTVTTTIGTGKRTIIENDIFNGSCPVRLFCVVSPQVNFNGTWDTNVFNFPWVHYSSCSVSVNNVTISTIQSKPEAYNQLREVLHKKILKCRLLMKILKVLPIRPTGVVNAHVEFSQNTDAGMLIFIGEFRNEII